MKKYLLGSLLLAYASQALSLEIQVSEITYMAPWATHVDVKMNATVVDAGCGQTDFYRLDLANDPVYLKNIQCCLPRF